MLLCHRHHHHDRRHDLQHRDGRRLSQHGWEPPYALPEEEAGAELRCAREEDAWVTELRFSHSILVARPPEVLYDLVSDVTRTGEWSPVCVSCRWDDGAGPQPGSWFTGRNRTPDRTWETRSEVVVAEPGKEFAFVVGGASVRWAFTMEPVADGTRLTESWEFLPAGRDLFRERYGETADAEIADRSRAAHRGIPASLAAIRRIAESS